MNKPNAYTQIIEDIFFKHYHKEDTEVAFQRSDIIESARKLDLKLPKNVGDIIYTFRYRANLPESIKTKAPKGKECLIRPAGQSKYKFVTAKFSSIFPSSSLAATKIPNSTP
jgi:hypothetical protein